MAYRFASAIRHPTDSRYWILSVEEWEPRSHPIYGCKFPRDFRRVGSFKMTIHRGRGFGSPRGVGEEIGPNVWDVLAVAGATKADWPAIGVMRQKRAQYHMPTDPREYMEVSA